MALIWKKGYFWPTFTFSSHQGKVLQHISQTHTYTYFAHPIDFFCPTNFEKKYEFIRYGFSLVWVLVLIITRAILEQSVKQNGEQNLSWKSTTDMYLHQLIELTLSLRLYTSSFGRSTVSATLHLAIKTSIIFDDRHNMNSACKWQIFHQL